MSTAKEIGSCELMREYATLWGKKIQVLSKGQNKVRVLVLATKGEIEIPKSYKVFEIEEEKDMSDSTEEEMIVKADEVIKELKSKQGSVSEVMSREDFEIGKQVKVQEKVVNPELKDKRGKRMKNGTIKQLVWDMLKKGVCTRTDLAKAAIAKGMTENSDIKKVKCYISVVLHQLQKKEGVNLVTLKPGTYKIEN